MDCIFCKIRDKELNHGIFYEDSECFAVPNRMSMYPGHVLLIPKKHEPDFWKVEKETFEHIAGIAQKISSVLIKEYNAVKIDLIISGFDVAHTHIHLIPVHDNKDLSNAFITAKSIANLKDEELENIKVKLQNKLC